MTRQLVGWLAFYIAFAFFGLDIARWTISGLALAGLILLVVWLWLIGGFRSSFWVEDDPTDEHTLLDELEEQR